MFLDHRRDNEVHEVILKEVIEDVCRCDEIYIPVKIVVEVILKLVDMRVNKRDTFIRLFLYPS